MNPKQTVRVLPIPYVVIAGNVEQHGLHVCGFAIFRSRDFQADTISGFVEIGVEEGRSDRKFSLPSSTSQVPGMDHHKRRLLLPVFFH
jgi:hypothetical protein